MTRPPDPLAPSLAGERREIEDAEAGRISYYVDGAVEGGPAGLEPPLLLIHSVNAAASAHEIKPLYDAFRAQRRTYAIDLPGYGHSERSDRRYLQRLMIDALHAVIAEIRAECGEAPVDALAVSLSCEFLARAATETPDAFRSLALVSPTGFSRRSKTKGPPDANRGNAAVYRFLTLPLVGRSLYWLLTVPPSVRFFLRKTWGRKQIDEEMFRNSCRMTRQPGARFAPFHFLSGYLFSAGIPAVYEALNVPVWLTHGVRGDFTDFSRTARFADRDDWRVTVYPTGALPYFELTDEFVDDYRAFLAHAAGPNGRDAYRPSAEHAAGSTEDDSER